MKKIIIPLLTILFFIPVIVNAETCDTDKVYIDSISVDKNNNVEVIENATASGKNIDLALGVSNVGDNIKYKVVVKNDSNEDYLIDKKSLSSKYIDYEIESDNNIIKAKSSKTIYLRVKYSNPVPADAYENGFVSDGITMKVNLSSNDVKNPNTGLRYLLFIVLVLSLMITMLIVFRKKKISTVMILIIGLSLIIPMSVYAICKCDISINSTVMISDKPFTGTIYRNSEERLVEGDSLKPMIGWAIVKDETNIPKSGFKTKVECEDEVEYAVSEGYIEEGKYYCKLTSFSRIGSYTLDPSELNRNFYIKDEITNNIVTKTQVCFVTDKEVCLTPEDNYEEVLNKLQTEETWFTNNGGSCDFSDTRNTYCTGAGFDVVGIKWELLYVSGTDYYSCDAYSCDYPVF